MNLSKINHWKGRYLALAFFIPFTGMLTVMLACGYEPFGKHSMLYSDMYHQYYPFFVEFRRAIRSGDGLLYNWSSGLGMDYLGLISYYLASPLNLLGVLVPESLTLEYFSLLMPIKLGLASLFFAIFLRGIFGKDDLSISLFGGLYGLCAWALGYQWNVMWLDTFALLPLVALGTVHLIRDKKVILYTVTLFLSIFSNYYIGFFTCIFVFLLFFCWEICRWQGIKRFFCDLLRIALFSVLAIGMTAILELPALAALQDTQSSVNKFPETFRLNMTTEHTVLGLLKTMVKVAGNMGGALEPTFKEGLPNLYCGVGSLYLGICFFFLGDVKLRDKLCCLFLLLFFNVSFIIRQLDYVWHGFHFTNMIPYRFSFLHSFVMLFMAYRAWLGRRKLHPLSLIAAFFLTAGLLCCSEELLSTVAADLGPIHLDIPVYLIYNSIFLVLIFVGMLIGQLRPRLPREADEVDTALARVEQYSRRKVSRLWIRCVIAMELVAIVVSFGIYFPGTNTTNYPKGTDEAASMIRYMNEREEDTLFYRAETTHSQTLNDGALNGYCGVSTFTSSANVKVTEFMKALGYGAKNTYNRYCIEESSPVANQFLGLKFMIERDGKDKESSMFTDVHHYGQVHLLQNNYYLPLGFLAQSQLADVDFGGDLNVFSFQNKLFTGATGMEYNVWYRLPEQQLEIVGDGVTVTDRGNAGVCDYSDASSGSTVTYRYTADSDGFMCIYLDLPKRNNFDVILNDVELYSESISLPQMLAVGDVKAGDVVQIRIKCKSGENSTMTVYAAILDEILFREGYAMLSESTWELTSFKSTRVAGTINCHRDGLMYTSIPQNGNWTATVDAEAVQTVLVGGCMIGIPLEAGSHEVILHYENEAFRLGSLVSLICFAAFAALTFLVYHPDLKKHLPKKA